MTAVPSQAPAPTEMRVGFVGLGRMGLPLALSLRRSGVPVVAYNRTQSKVEPLVAAGGTWAVSPKELARGVVGGVVFLMLSDGKAVERVLFSRSGVVRGAKSGTLVVDLSTIDPEESRTLAVRLGEKGVHYVDAPVGGSIDNAARGEVTFFVGGDEHDVARVRPLLERMGRAVQHMGPVGAGTSMKLVNNLLTIGNTVLSTEALSLAEAYHLEPGRTLELLTSGGARSTMLERKSGTFEARRYPAQFTTALARKDLRLIEKAGTREHHPLRMIHEARRLLDEAIAQGHSEDDFSSVLEATLARARTVGPKPASPAQTPTAPATPGSDPP